MCIRCYLDESARREQPIIALVCVLFLLRQRASRHQWMSLFRLLVIPARQTGSREGERERETRRGRKRVGERESE